MCEQCVCVSGVYVCVCEQCVSGMCVTVVCVGRQAVHSDAFMDVQHTTFVKAPFVFA